MKQMDFLELVKKRQSTRSYSDKQVEKEKIDRCLEAGRLAPSACNAQPWSFIVIDDPGLKNQVADLTADRLLPLNHFTKQAPVHIIIVIEKANLTSNLGSLIKDKFFPWIDIGIAAEHICLQATSEGLGTCILGWFKEKKIKKLLNVPDKKRIGLLITVGYPKKEEIRQKKRKALADIVHYNTYKL